MKVCSIPFLMTVSKHIKFGSAGHLKTMQNKNIITAFKSVISLYHRQGFHVQIILADNQFETLRGDLAELGVHINVVSRNKHVPDIERYQRTIKERVQGKYNTLSFEHCPPIFIIEMVFHSVF